MSSRQSKDKNINILNTVDVSEEEEEIQPVRSSALRSQSKPMSAKLSQNSKLKKDAGILSNTKSSSKKYPSEEDTLIVRTPKGETLPRESLKKSSSSANKSSGKEPRTPLSEPVWEGTPSKKSASKSLSIGRKSKDHRVDPSVNEYLKDVLMFVMENNLSLHGIYRLFDLKQNLASRNTSKPYNLSSCAFLLDVSMPNGVSFFINEFVEDKECDKPEIDEFREMEMNPKHRKISDRLETHLAETEILDHVVYVSEHKDIYYNAIVNNQSKTTLYCHTGMEHKKMRNVGTYHLCIPTQFLKNDNGKFIDNVLFDQIASSISSFESQLFMMHVKDSVDSVKKTISKAENLLETIKESIETKMFILSKLGDEYSSVLVDKHDYRPSEHHNDNIRGFKHLAHELIEKIKHGKRKFEVIEQLIIEEKHELSHLKNMFEDEAKKQLWKEKTGMTQRGSVFIEMAAIPSVFGSAIDENNFDLMSVATPRSLMDDEDLDDFDNMLEKELNIEDFEASIEDAMHLSEA